MNILETLRYNSSNQIRMVFNHFHDVTFNGCKYHRFHEVISVKGTHDPTPVVKHKVEWWEILPRNPKHTADTVRTLSSKEVKKLGIEKEFLEANPKFKTA